MAVTLLFIPVDIQKIVLRQLQHQRKEHKQFPHNFKMDVLGEILDLLPMFLHHIGMLTPVSLDKLRRVVNLRVVLDAIPDLADAARLVAVVAAVLEVGSVFDLLVCGQVEDLFAEAELAVDFFLGEAEVYNVEEPFSSHGIEMSILIFDRWCYAALRACRIEPTYPIHCVE